MALCQWNACSIICQHTQRHTITRSAVLGLQHSVGAIVQSEIIRGHVVQVQLRYGTLTDHMQWALDAAPTQLLGIRESYALRPATPVLCLGQIQYEEQASMQQSHGCGKTRLAGRNGRNTPSSCYKAQC